MRIKVFVSSVQKELADERMALQVLLSTDPFLVEHCVPILFEEEPSALHPNPKEYLQLLETCQVYLGVMWREYGNVVDEHSATHHEYNRAQELKLPTLITVKGGANLKRDAETQAFFNRIRTDGHTYDRFTDVESLQKKVRARLIKHIGETYAIEPTADQEHSAQLTMHVASSFERQRLTGVPWGKVNRKIATEIASAAEGKKLMISAVRGALRRRGYLWRDEDENYFATAAGIVLFASDPSVHFSHTRVEIAAYSGKKRNAALLDHATLRLPIPTAIDETVSFIRKNTRQPLRIVGLKKVPVDEYPEEALREALVNALAHRDYEDTSARVMIDLFKDRIEISSPGSLAGNLTITKLRGGSARSRSRNPGIAQGLVFLHRMEERGTGIQRMKNAMLNHGLDKPKLTLDDDIFTVMLPGPGEDLDRIRTPKDDGAGIPPSVEAKLNKRQKKILNEVVKNGSVTTKWCKDTFGVVQDTAARDLKKLTQLKLLESRGKGRGTHYVLKA